LVRAQRVLGRNGLEAGLLLVPITLLNIVLAPLAGAIYFFTEQQTGVRSMVPARAVFHAVTVILIGTRMLSFFRGNGKTAERII